MSRGTGCIMALMMILCAGECSAVRAQGLYESPDGQFAVSFEYPHSWEVSQGAGSYGAYKQIMAYEPPAAGREGVGPGIVLTQEDRAKALTGAATAAEYIAEIAALRARIPDYRQIARGAAELLGENAEMLECAYSVPDRLHGSTISSVAVRERIVVARKGDYFYTLRYLNAERGFDDYRADAARAQETLTLR